MIKIPLYSMYVLNFRALELDCLKNSHPIEVPVGHPSEIDEIFDDISYNKGASVIRMLHRYIGDDDFRKGMNIYLTRHQVNYYTHYNLQTLLSTFSLHMFTQDNNYLYFKHIIINCFCFSTKIHSQKTYGRP